MQKKYGVLRTIAGLYQLIGMAIPLLSLPLIMLFMINDIWGVIAVIIPVFLVAMFTYGFGQIILVLLDIEENSRRSAIALDRLTKNKRKP